MPVPVEGTLVRAGKPLDKVQVIFYPERESGTIGPKSVGETDAAGRFTLTILADPDNGNGLSGAVPGKHRVVLRPSPSERGTGDKPVALRFGEEYTNFDRTPLRVEVKPPSTNVELEVK